MCRAQGLRSFRGEVPRGFHSSTTVPPGFHQISTNFFKGLRGTRVAPGFHQFLRGLRGGPGWFEEGSRRVPRGFHKGSTRVPRSTSGCGPGWVTNFHQGSTRVPPGLARAVGWSAVEVEVRSHERSIRVPPAKWSGVV